VTVGAQEHEVLEAVVVLDAVRVMEGHHERLAVPLGQPAALAAVLLQPRGEEATLEVIARDRAAGGEPSPC
jgi:hypothetical protein